MTTRFTLLIALIPAMVVLRAADIPELTRLRESYHAAVAKAVKPIIQAHIIDLEKLRDAYSRAANLDAAIKVRADIDAAYQSIAFAGSDSKPVATPPGPGKGGSGKQAAGATPELDRLRASHKTALEKATKPLTQSYVKELERLRDGQTRASNLDAAKSVQTEINAITNPGAIQPPDTGWLIGKVWATDAGNTLEFSRGGIGVRTTGGGKTKTPLRWKVAASGLVEAQQGDDPKSILYIEFKSATEGAFGTSEDKRSVTIHAR